MLILLKMQKVMHLHFYWIIIDGTSKDAYFDCYVVGINEVIGVPATASALLFGSSFIRVTHFVRFSIHIFGAKLIFELSCN